MNLTISPKVEEALNTLAERRGVAPADLAASLLAEEVYRQEYRTRVNGTAQLNGAETDEPENPDALARAVAAMINRTPEQRRAARERAIREFRPEYDLPPGKTIFDVVKWPGDETEEEIFAALDELS